MSCDDFACLQYQTTFWKWPRKSFSLPIKATKLISTYGTDLSISNLKHFIKKFQYWRSYSDWKKVQDIKMWGWNSATNKIFLRNSMRRWVTLFFTPHYSQNYQFSLDLHFKFLAPSILEVGNWLKRFFGYSKRYLHIP